MIALLLAIDLAWAGDELVRADTVIRIGKRTFGEKRVITAIAVSPDGKFLAEVGGTAGREGRVAVWEIAGGKLVWEAKAHRDLVYDVAWSPDGKRVYTAGGDGRIGVFEDGKEIKRLFGHAGAVVSLAVAPDGMLASGGTDRSIRLWADDACVREIHNHSGRVGALAFRADGKRLASGSADGTVRVWQPDTGRLLKIIRDHGDEVLALAWLGEKIVSGAADGRVRLVDPENASVEKVLRAHEDWVVALAVSGERVASADASGKTVEK